MRPPAQDDFAGWVEHLADPVRARRAYRHLVLSGAPSLPAVRAGLGHANADVRSLCTKALDHLVDAESYAALVAMVEDPAPRVRMEALHALACDRCKENEVPRGDEVLALGLSCLRSDPDRHARASAVELVGRFVHTAPVAAAALVAARDGDPHPTVRKKAGWYAPGGTIHRKTRPR